MLSKGMIQACEYIDSTIFSGDGLYENEDLAEFEVYLSRWKREIAAIKKVLKNESN